MKILITGASGFVGTELARKLLGRGHMLGNAVTALTLADLHLPAAALATDPRVTVRTGSLLDLVPAFAAERFDLVFHLAGAVSAECEASFELGMSSNLDSTRALLDALRAAGNTPRLVFSSSVAVFGGDAGLPLPAVITDATLPVPQSSYGIQKFIAEQLVADYTRKGFIDGRSGRLMTVVVRAGKPNGAASSFLSSIVREPLSGQEAVCPVPLEMPVALASPKNTIAALITLAEAERDQLGGRTAINFPALTVRVGDILDALEAMGGKAARALVRAERDAAIENIVGSWPSRIESVRASALGLEADKDMLSIVRQFVEHTKTDATKA